MKKSLVLFLMFLPVIIFSQNINGRISSSLYSFERFNDKNNSENYIRTFQSVYLNVNKSNFSLRTRVNLESDISSPLDNDPRLRFYNLYFELRNILKSTTLKVGRQPIFNSVAGGLFDGASFKSKISGFTVSGYYGGNVPAYQKLELTDSFSDDYILGGKVEYSGLKNFNFAASYVNKNFKSEDYTVTRLDENYNPIQLLIKQNSNQYEFLSGKASYQLKDVISINTRYDFDMNYNTTSKFEVSTRYEKIKNLGLSLYYNYREPRVRYNSIFSVFNFGNTSEIEAGVDYKINNIFTVVGKYGNVTYKTEDSQRLTIGLNSNYGNISYRKTLGYAGELDAISVYTAKSFMDGKVTPSIGLSLTKYKLSENEEEQNITSLLGGVNVRPFKTLSFDLQGQYYDNKIYSNDFRLLFKINYWFNSNLEL